MSANVIDGNAIASRIRVRVREAVAARREQNKPAPGLAVVLLGDDPPSRIYVEHKRRDCQKAGLNSYAFDLPASTSEKELIARVRELNEDPAINGILVQLPVPEHIDEQTVIEAIRPDKDVDGFHPYNLGRLAGRHPVLRPCTPHGVMRLLESIRQPIKGHHAVVVGASNIVGRPMLLELLLVGATVTVCHRFTQDTAQHVRQADILIAAAGKPNLIPGEWIKRGATVVDVGVNRLEDGSLAGDVSFEEARQRAAWITPVPGGVGPMTRAMLLENTLQATRLQEEKAEYGADFLR